MSEYMPSEEGAPAEKTLDERLFDIHYRILKTVTDEQGYGGPVAHKAEVDGWQLFISSQGVRMWSSEESYGFEITPGNTYAPITVNTKPEHLALLVSLAERAEWEDTVERPEKQP